MKQVGAAQVYVVKTGSISHKDMHVFSYNARYVLYFKVILPTGVTGFNLNSFRLREALKL